MQYSSFKCRLKMTQVKLENLLEIIFDNNCFNELFYRILDLVDSYVCSILCVLKTFIVYIWILRHSIVCYVFTNSVKSL